MNNKILIAISECGILVGFMLFAGVLVEAGQSIGNGMYAASIYEEYSTLFWVLFLGSGFCGITRVLIDIFMVRSGYRWLWGIFLLVGLTAFILSVPIFRDYEFHGQYDTVAHYSHALEIFEYGRPHLNDFYPTSHVLASILASTAGISVRESVLVLPILMYLIGVSNAFLLAWIIDDRPEVRGLIVMMSVLPIFTFYQSMFYPLQMAVYFLWLFAALFLRTRIKGVSMKDSVLLILVLLLMPFIHPLGVIAALFLIISFFIFEMFRKRDIGKRDKGAFFYSLDRVIAPFTILFVSWFTWFSSFRTFGVSLNRIYESLFNELSGQSFTLQYSSVIDRANRDVVEILRLTLFVHGPALLWGVLILIVVVLYVIKVGKVIEINAFLIIYIVIFYGLGVLSLVVDIIAVAPNRYINYGVALAPFLVAPFFIHFYAHSKRMGRALLLIILVVSIGGAFGIGTSNLFRSDIVRTANHQFSSAQLSGYQFLADFNSNSDRKVYSPLPRVRGIFALGPYSDQLNLLQSTPVWQANEAPEHFGYLGEPDRLGRWFKNPEYLTVTAFDKWVYMVGPQKDKFSPNDFDLLEFDGRWHEVYDSGDFSLRVWREEE
jgi:hypothetical protein